VVPQESPASWQPGALQAQAVEARTFATAKMRAASATATSDICDTASCQVFNGSGTYTASGTRTAVEQVSTDAAITAIAGVILAYQGTVALTEFAASSGGWTAPGGQPTSWASRTRMTVRGELLSHLASQLAGLIDREPVSRRRQPSTDGRDLAQRLRGLGRPGHRSSPGRDERRDHRDRRGSEGRATLPDLHRPAPLELVRGREPSTFTRAVPALVRHVDLVDVTWLSLGDAGRRNLVVYDAVGMAHWASGTFVPGSALRVQADGDVVLVNQHGFGLWETMTHTVGSYLVMQDDGNLVLYAPSGAALWDSAGYTCHRAQYLRPPTEVQTLASGMSAPSVNGTTHLAMQTDGNLVLYNGSWQARWASGTFLPGNRADVQSDGNFVVYRPSGAPAWTAAVYSPGAYLIVQDDGNAVLYSSTGKALWDGLG